MGLTILTSKPSSRHFEWERYSYGLRTLRFDKNSRSCRHLSDSSAPALFLLFSVMPGFFRSLLVQLSVTKRTTWLAFHRDVLTASQRNNFMTSLCATKCWPSLPCQSLWYPSMALSCPAPPWLGLCLSWSRLLCRASSISWVWSALYLLRFWLMFCLLLSWSVNSVPWL